MLSSVVFLKLRSCAFALRVVLYVRKVKKAIAVLLLKDRQSKKEKNTVKLLQNEKYLPVDGKERLKMPKSSSYINPVSGIRIKEQIRARHLKQCDLAKEINISQKHLSNIISGRKALTLENAQILAEKLGVRYEYLLGTDNFPTEEDLTVCFNQAWEEAEKEDSAFPILFELVGFKVQAQRMAKSDGTTVRTNYLDVFHDGELCCTCSESDIERLKSEIKDFTEFKLGKLCGRKDVDNG